MTTGAGIHLWRGARQGPPLNRDQLLMLQEDNVGEAWRAAGLFKLRSLSFAEGIERYLNPDWSCADAGKE